MEINEGCMGTETVCTKVVRDAGHVAPGGECTCWKEGETDDLLTCADDPTPAGKRMNETKNPPAFETYMYKTYNIGQQQILERQVPEKMVRRNARKLHEGIAELLNIWKPEVKMSMGRRTKKNGKKWNSR